MKQIISTIMLLVMALPVGAQEVVKLLEPAYADSGAVYRQSVYVPQTWSKRRVVLWLERPQGATKVRVNGIEMDGDTVVNMPHQLDVSSAIVAGQRNAIEVRVAGRGSQDGVMGGIELRSQPSKLYINKVKTHARPFLGLVGVELELGGTSPDISFYGVRTMVQRDGVDTAKVYVNEWDVTARHMMFETPVLDADRFWDEFHPHVYRLAVGCGADYQECTFGMREAGVVDGQLYINRYPVYLRGAVMDDYFPLWGRMPMDVATWQHMLQRLKDFGLNHVRFNGYCPPEAAFAAADELGMYLQPYAESTEDMARITDCYGNHPSLVLISVGRDCFVWNAGKATPVSLRQEVILRGSVLAYKQAVERRLIDAADRHVLLGGLCDTNGDLTGVLHGCWSDGDDAVVTAKVFRQFCGPIVPLVKQLRHHYQLSDTLRVPVLVYNAMYGNLRAVRTSFYLSTDSGRVVAGGMVASGDVPLDTICPLGEVVFPLDSIKRPCKLKLTLTVGNSSVRNHWDIEVKP